MTRIRRCCALAVLLVASVAAPVVAAGAPAHASDGAAAPGTPPPATGASSLRGIYGSVPLRPKDAELIRTSNDMEELFLRRGYVLTSGPDVDLVKRVGAAVAPKHPADDYQRFRFGIVDSPVPNAFALPDGQIYVHSGLLAILENEAQLAAVLAHECMHVEGHHTFVNARQARHKAGGMLALSVVLGNIGNLVNIAFEAAMLGYGRDLEAEADRGAIPRLLEAGYDPREMPRIFELLDADPEGDRVQPKTATWSDHPLGRERRRYTSEILDSLANDIAAKDASGTPLVVGEDGFLVQVTGCAKKAVRDLVDADRPRTALEVAHRLTAQLPEDPDGWALVGDALVALDARTPLPEPEELTKKAKRAKQRDESAHTRYERAVKRLGDAGAGGPLDANRALAEQSYRKALELRPEQPAALAGLGRLSELRGHDAEAGRYFARYLRAAPETDAQRLAVMRRLEVLTERLGHAGAAPQPAASKP